MNTNWQRRIRLLLAITGCCTVLITGCASPTVDPLPPESQSGKGVLGCRINGEVWLPNFDFSKDFKRGGTGQIARYSPRTSTLYVGGTDDYGGGSINVSLTGCTHEGLYALDSQSADVLRPTSNSGSFSPTGYIGENTYWTTSQYSGQVIITRFTDHIVSGRFSFTALNQKTGKTVRITDGRFDFLYGPGVDD